MKLEAGTLEIRYFDVFDLDPQSDGLEFLNSRHQNIKNSISRTSRKSNFKSSSMDKCIFCKIAKRDIEIDFTYEDKDIMVFPDIHPVAPIHLLIIPKKHIRDFGDFRDDVLLGKIRTVVQRMIKEHKIEDKGYRLVVNGGGAQLIDHLHIHLMGKIGRKVKL